MNALDFHELVVDEISIDIEVAHLTTPLDDLPDWDSVYLLKLVTAIERRTGKSVPVSALLDPACLDDIRQAIAP
ncbi:acyl carrier protein [Mycobacterium montefiorense]|uniref:Carrier domain-containing protein n=1 Tax=Mycobacterium montefiorense TaxID=154654 RepID=A0AA37PMS7_9MYCO|nr:acyl carrier protein [Mycobacterium montefiorense]MCV7426904.1 acyl carrier protein [Mycobacterium montefiorense]GBG35990.1 hypothetical protein MmonteBS_03620 [Mycobacterium montefiorense]GKU33990.1 hypothetical protein NJB14191_13360 [Mycobacterium montefiorense]GKU41388.1 hypothetical protein NJB14192_33720 [Mycobacterium montefiorense]GKU47486.1 hypothetical protein NJB14194_41040 [Mycobacterium montefiorense]